MSEPNQGIMVVLCSNSIVGRSARRLLPVALIAPLLLGGATTMALHVHAGYGLFLAFLVVILSMILFSYIIWTNTLTLMDQVERAEAFQAQLAEVERRRMFKDLEAANDKLSLALEGANLGSWHWDLESGERAWSDQCKRMYGVPLDTEMSAATLTRCVHPEDRRAMEDARQNAIRKSKDYFIEYRVVWPDSTIHWIESKGRVYRDASGKALRFEGISQDVSERHLIEERQQMFLKDMLASVTDAKLTLCINDKELPKLLKPVTETIEITASNGGIRVVRDAAYEACLAANLPIERCYDMKTAAAEAAMNSAVHAVIGTGQVFVGDNGTVQVMVTDHGKGIALANLPNATLKKGYTTAGTLGHGMKMMLQTVDRVYLLTGSNGTTVIVEQDLEMKEVLW